MEPSNGLLKEDREGVKKAVPVLTLNLLRTNMPSMPSVVSMLEGRVAAQELISGSTVSNDDSEALRNLFQQIVEGNVSKSETPL
ncbi:hypothetical protein FEM48_Zijuj12G0152400 [Ziziphus jujuba var. spinosa]|uniref:Uncharacterized protein n=1 Tax=Ziziphus jujuba var. spinosa TaxID=714518 RepID=A0A978UE30_ZIZJJ|nr:hypothetical protein FEM48_Zijuj12G0152400 [Ziziphus jujuba var. spinosa]